MVNFLQASVKTAAFGVMFFGWIDFTIEAFKIACFILSTSPEEDETKQRVMCEECHGYFLDDGGELIYGRLLCESCSDDIVSDQLEKK